jgi:hypothetical protein
VSYGPAVEMVVTLTTTTATSSIPGNTAAAATGWALASGSAYITPAQTSADEIIVSWELSGTAAADVGLWVTADGAETATVGGVNCIYLPAASTSGTTSVGQGSLVNIQAIPNWNVINGVATYRDGVTKAFDQSQSVNFTAQSGMTGLHLWNTAPNWLSFCPDTTIAMTGHVTVTFQ